MESFKLLMEEDDWDKEDPDSYWDKEDDEIDGLDATIIKKYGEGSLDKLRKKKAEIEAGFGNQIQHGIQVVLGSPHVIMDNLETTSNQEVDSNLKKSNIEAVNGGSSSPSQNTITEEDAEVTSLVNGKELGFHGGNHNDMAGSSKGSGHANEGGGNTTNPNVAADGIKESWSSILGRHVVSKKNLPFYAPTIVEGKPIVHVKSNQFTHLQHRFENLIIGGFVGKKLPFGFVRETLTRTWKLKNNFIMKAYGETMFSFQFRSEEDRKAVLEMGSLHIASQLFILRPWKLFIEAEFNDLKTIPIWVVMKKFPIELWDDEVDTRCTYPDHATVVHDEKRTFKIPFEYNWKPQRCTSCDVFGHNVSNCPKTKMMKKKKAGDKVWVQTSAMISIDVEEYEMGADKKEETINEEASNPADGDNKQCNEK
ncbi:hypothetical protein FRX31_032454, partial [Thalictrum thalictroides]